MTGTFTFLLLSLPYFQLEISKPFIYITIFNGAGSKLGSILTKMGPFFKLYSTYVNNYPNALSILAEQTKHNARFREQLEVTFLRVFSYLSELRIKDESKNIKSINSSNSKGSSVSTIDRGRDKMNDNRKFR
jgi:hypothetical protein